MKVKEIILLAMLASILLISKEILAFLPNIELVSFLLILYTLALGWRLALLIAVVFSSLEIIIYGMGLWTVMYIILWPMLCLLTWLYRKWLINENRLALFSGLFGFFFGLFYEIPYFIVDFNLGFSVYLKGLPFDLVHGIGNYLVMLVLYQPLYCRFLKLIDRFQK